jgi:DNA-binding transcriptional regulator LsrR (DeoR family)
MDTNHHALLARVAAMYYDEELNQADIGKALGLSRVKVYRLLKDARASGVVQITIHWPIQRNAELERALVERFGLRHALVLARNTTDDDDVLREVGRLGAQYLDGVLRDGDTLAICLGRSTHEVVSAMRARAPVEGHARVRVAQAVGSIPYGMQAFDSATIGRQLAERLGGDVLYLSSPMMADTPESADVIRRQPHVQATLDAARNADVALVGIGSLESSAARLLEAGFVNIDDVAALRAQGAVGDLAGRMFGVEGQNGFDHNRRVVGITHEDLRRIPLTLAAVSGPERAPAIIGALRSGTVRVLCTDDATAAGVLNA